MMYEVIKDSNGYCRILRSFSHLKDLMLKEENLEDPDEPKLVKPKNLEEINKAWKDSLSHQSTWMTTSD